MEVPSFETLSSKICSLETFTDGKMAFLNLKTDDGISGWGEFGGKDIDITLELFHRRVAPVVFGKAIGSPVKLIDSVIRFELNYKMLGVQFSKALAGLDSAVWDALGKRFNKSVCELISGTPLRPYPCYASSISRKISPKILASKLVGLKRDHGIKAFKIKIGKRMGHNEDQWPGRTENIVKECRNALGNDCLIGVDANGAYDDVSHAKVIAKLLEDNGYWFFEEPFPWMEYDKYSELQKMLQESGYQTFVAGGEQEFRMDVWKLLITNLKPWFVSQPDCGYCGGPTMALLIAKLSETHGMKFMPHSPQGDLMPIMAWHLLCAMSSLNAFTHMELACVNDGIAQVQLNHLGEYEAKYFGPCMVVKDGNFSLASNKPISGWGIEMNEDWLKAAKKKKFNLETSSSTKRSWL